MQIIDDAFGLLTLCVSELEGDVSPRENRLSLAKSIRLWLLRADDGVTEENHERYEMKQEIERLKKELAEVKKRLSSVCEDQFSM